MLHEQEEVLLLDIAPADPFIDNTMFDPEDPKRPQQRIHVSMCQTIALACTVQYFIMLVAGYILYATSFMQLLAPHTLVVPVFLSVLGADVGTHALLAWARRSWPYNVVLLGLVIALNVCFVALFSMLLGDTVAFQYVLMMWLASVAVLGYTLLERRELVDEVLGVCVLVAILVAWLAGFYTFYEQHDWLLGGAVLLIGLINGTYLVGQFHAARKRYNAASQWEATINYHVDPLVALADVMRAAPPPPPPVEMTDLSKNESE